MTWSVQFQAALLFVKITMALSLEITFVIRVSLLDIIYSSYLRLLCPYQWSLG